MRMRQSLTDLERAFFEEAEADRERRERLYRQAAQRSSKRHIARRAAAENARLVAGRQVRLVLDVEPRDRFGRLLAYVYRAGDGLFVNATLVRGGYARTLTIPPNVRYAARFAALARQARRSRRGLWSACPPA